MQEIPDLLVAQTLKKYIRVETLTYLLLLVKLIYIYIYIYLSGLPGHSGLTRFSMFLHLSVFCLTRTDPATGSTRQAGLSLITIGPGPWLFINNYLFSPRMRIIMADVLMFCWD